MAQLGIEAGAERWTGCFKSSSFIRGSDGRLGLVPNDPEGNQVRGCVDLVIMDRAPQTSIKSYANAGELYWVVVLAEGELSDSSVQQPLLEKCLGCEFYRKRSGN
jgi:hypothetical protein